MSAPAPTVRGWGSLPTARLGVLLLAALSAAPAAAETRTALDRCLAARGLPRVARVVAPDGRVVFARVAAEDAGIPTAVAPLGLGQASEPTLAEVFDRAALAAAARHERPTLWPIEAAERGTRICAPLRLGQAQIDAEERVVVAAGLNYAAHADEAGGGDVFLFPKPAAPTRPYGELPVPPGVTLLDYEVELGFVLLADLPLRDLPEREALLARTAFFVANDVSDREPIIREKALTGPGTGFVEGKGRPGFLPLGPWMVRGSELFAALAACGADGLALRLAVDEGQGFRPRQQASTERMLLDPVALLTRLAEEVERAGPRTSMPARSGDALRYYPLAVGALAPRLPAGSIVLTGTPEGVAIQAPAPLPVALRGLLRLRSPFAQFLREEQARAAAGDPGGYLAPGDRVRASIDGLGAQLFRITAPGSPPPEDACEHGAPPQPTEEDPTS